VTTTANLGNETWLTTQRKGISAGATASALFLGFEHSENTINGLTGIDRVEGAENKMSVSAALKAISPYRDRAYFADQNSPSVPAEGSGAVRWKKRIKV